MGCALPVAPRAPRADEICGAEPLHPLGQVSALQAEQAPGNPRVLRCWRRRSCSHPWVKEQGGSEPELQRTEMQPGAHKGPCGGDGGSSSCRRVNTGSQRCSSGRMASIPCLPDTWTRGMQVLDLHHETEHSGTSSEGCVSTSSTSGLGTRMSLPLLTSSAKTHFSPHPSKWSLPLPLHHP